MMASFILCLLPALLATTSAQGTLTCEMCYGLAETCQAAPGTCTVTKGVGGCRSAAGESTLGETKTSVFSKECINDYNSGINVPITFTVGNGKYLRLNASRCNNADNCNSAVLDVPQRNINPNGWQCPTCFALNSGSCTSQVTLCTGDEIHCINFTGQIVKGSTFSAFAAQGCGTASTQNIKSGTFLTSRVNTYLFTQATSTPAEIVTTTPPTTTALETATTATTSPITINTITTTNNTIITTPFFNTTITTNTTTAVITLTIPITTITVTHTNTTTTITITTPANTVTITTITIATNITTTTNTTPPTTTTTTLPETTTTTTETIPPQAAALNTITSRKAIRVARSGGSPALGKFSFALYLPGLTGLLLVKLLS